MRPLTYTRPKHLLPLANRPFLEYQVALLRRHGVHDIVFAAGYCADQIQAYLGAGTALGVRMRYAVEAEPLGTAGAIRNAASLQRGETALVLNGDILTDFDLARLMEAHASRQAWATLALREVARPHAFGVLTVAEDGRVRSWHEPSEAEKKLVPLGAATATQTDLINAGIYVLSPDLIEGIPRDRFVSIERETYPEILAAGAPVYGIAMEGHWLDMGSPAAYRAANAAVLTGAVDTDVPFTASAKGALIAPDAVVDEQTSIGANCRVGSGARLRRCIILDGTTVGAGADLADLVADEGSVIGDDVSSHQGAVLAAGSRVGRGSRI